MFKSANTTIEAADFKKAVKFYVETLGLNLQFQIEGHLAQIEAPGLTIWIIHPKGADNLHHELSESISIGFEVEKLNSEVELLKSKGIKFQRFMDSETTRFAYFNDPDGNLLYLIELKPQAGEAKK
ncbi:VOC family protein [Candidatus Clostridium stratigraminis]|uniref:VOC family protein n=1 Tax=Candidatus Clostridium stratigraminis TaxID=3381661 RepID=A0ABW8T4Q4_9CLOT